MNTVTIQAANEQVEFTFISDKTLTRKTMIDLVHEIGQHDVEVFASKLQAHGISNIEIDYVDDVKDVFVTKSGALKRAIVDYELFDKMRAYEEYILPVISQEMIDSINQQYETNKRNSDAVVCSDERQYLSYDDLTSGKTYYNCRKCEDDDKNFIGYEYVTLTFKNIQVINGLPLDLDVIRNEVVPNFCEDGSVDFFVKRCSFEKKNDKMMYYFDYTFKDSQYTVQIDDKVLPLGDVLLMLPEVQEKIVQKMGAPFEQWQDVTKSKSQYFDYYPSDDGDGYRR